ncbi:hypothetical protein OS493_004862 [Desmophyllum pertusum]|uniref:G-protein coupled receptors family 1 profile domain-containing protein n=1 Tax=Desmophyllum pertusum TaxID=174260 RepID=A0A9W9Z537_9CNID|nr:hypothetical protein OS493_004862 [Desmophyllum pertusum]
MRYRNKQHVRLLRNLCEGEIDLQPLEGAASSPGDTSEEQCPALETVVLPEDGFHSVYVSAVETPGLFFIQLRSSEESLEDLRQQINSGVNRVDLEESEITIGSLCVAQWYRARVLGSRPENEYDVFYVDFGDREWVTADRIVPGWRSILQLPLQAIECSLVNMDPVENEWSEESNDAFWEMANDQLLVAKVKSTSASLVAGCHRFVIELYNTTTEHDVIISHEMVATGHAQTSPEGTKMLFPYSSLSREQEEYDFSHQRIPDMCLQAHQYWFLSWHQTVFVCVLVCFNKTLRTYTNWLILSLAVSDILTGGVLLPIFLINPASAALGYISATILLSGVANICAVTYDRYVAIMTPLHYPYRAPKLFKRAIVVFVAGSSYLQFNSAVLGGRSCQNDPRSQVRRSLALRRDYESVTEQMKQRARISADAQVAKVFCIVSSAFLLSWMPILYMTTAGTVLNQVDIIPMLCLLFLFSQSATSSLVNPLTYAFLQQDFKVAIRNLCRKNSRVETVPTNCIVQPVSTSGGTNKNTTHREQTKAEIEDKSP